MKSLFKWIAAIIVVAIASILLVKLIPNKPKPEPAKPLVATSMHKVIGESVQGRSIDSYTYGNGSTTIAFVGGMHGGYEWNSVMLAYKFKKYLDSNPGVIPKNLSIVVIPDANPDGTYSVVGKEGEFDLSDVSTDKKVLVAGRLNANRVDLNRNFDCKWNPKGTWQSKTVSTGTGAFSEPESKAIQDFVLKVKPKAVIFWHSQSGSVYGSQCKKGILPATLDIMNAYAKASGYTAVKSFDAYPVTGDSEGWLASINIPALTVELTTHDSIEWDKNLAGVKAILNYYSKK